MSGTGGLTRRSTTRWGGRLPHLALLACLSACALPEGGFLGPPPMRNQHPAELTVLHLGPRSARVAPPGGGTARTLGAWTNQLVFSHSHRDEPFIFDYEFLRISAPVCLGLGRGFDLELEPAFLVSGAGVLDEFVADFHDSFGFDHGLREGYPDNQYNVFIRHGGRNIFEVDGAGTQVTDLPLVLSRQLHDGDHPWLPRVLGRVGVEIPLGSQRRGGGNGGWDLGLGLVASRRIGLVEVTGNVSLVQPATPDRVRRAGYDYFERFAAGLSAEFALTPELVGLVHLQAHRSVLTEFHAERLSRTQAVLWLGGRINCGRGVFIEGMLGEGLTQKVTPDFTILTSLGLSF